VENNQQTACFSFLNTQKLNYSRIQEVLAMHRYPMIHQHCPQLVSSLRNSFENNQRHLRYLVIFLPAVSRNPMKIINNIEIHSNFRTSQLKVRKNPSALIYKITNYAI